MLQGMRVGSFALEHSLGRSDLLSLLLLQVALAMKDPVSIPDQRLVSTFFSVSACSWVPHWACHYYRLETHSTFVVGRWSFSEFDSAVSLIVYSMLVVANVAALSLRARRSTIAFVSGACHIAIGLVHLYRLISPFDFQVIGHFWTLGASLREVAIVIPFGALSIFVAVLLRKASGSIQRPRTPNRQRNDTPTFEKD